MHSINSSINTLKIVERSILSLVFFVFLAFPLLDFLIFKIMDVSASYRFIYLLISLPIISLSFIFISIVLVFFLNNSRKNYSHELNNYIKECLCVYFENQHPR